MDPQGYSIAITQIGAAVTVVAALAVITIIPTALIYRRFRSKCPMADNAWGRVALVFIIFFGVLVAWGVLFGWLSQCVIRI